MKPFWTQELNPPPQLSNQKKKKKKKTFAPYFLF